MYRYSDGYIRNGVQRQMIILASASPRRAELFGNLGVKFEIHIPLVDEKRAAAHCAGRPAEMAETLARAKASAVCERFPEDIAVGADTVVSLDGKSFGKPVSETDAYRMLSALSGRTHTVYTGVAVGGPRGIYSSCVKTDILFGTLSETQIKEYIATGEPMDKAGAYAIQGAAREFVSKISGDYFSVVGLPLGETVRLLRMQGVDI